MNYSLYANILQIKNYIPIEKNECKNLIKLIQLPSLAIMEFEDAFFNTKDYKLLNQTLGRGAFGTVYIAENTNDHNKYAAKVINTDAGFDGREQMQFLRESL